jgi:hypothetical protein
VFQKLGIIFGVLFICQKIFSIPLFMRVAAYSVFDARQINSSVRRNCFLGFFYEPWPMSINQSGLGEVARGKKSLECGREATAFFFPVDPRAKVKTAFSGRE